jgi:cation:H+ antiporter
MLILLGLIAGGVLVVAGADLLVDGLLGVGARIGVSPFILVVVLSGFELENLAAGIAANAKGLPGAAAGTVFGGVTFLALGVAGLGALIAPIQAKLPKSFLLGTAVAPLPTVALSLDGRLSRLDGAVLLAWFAVVLTGVARSGRSVLGSQPPRRQRLSGLRLIGGLAVLTIGGDLLAESLRRIVTGLGVSATLLGNTAVAAGVEVEEVGRVAVPRLAVPAAVEAPPRDLLGHLRSPHGLSRVGQHVRDGFPAPHRSEPIPADVADGALRPGSRPGGAEGRPSGSPTSGLSTPSGGACGVARRRSGSDPALPAQAIRPRIGPTECR